METMLNVLYLLAREVYYGLAKLQVSFKEEVGINTVHSHKTMTFIGSSGDLLSS